MRALQFAQRSVLVEASCDGNSSNGVVVIESTAAARSIPSPRGQLVKKL
jgi:hypothetical protein